MHVVGTDEVPLRHFGGDLKQANLADAMFVGVKSHDVFPTTELCRTNLSCSRIP
jgi:hypothetical protein